jgi:hypothetical protein
MRSMRLCFVVLAAALVGCSSVKVRTEYDPAAPFKTYRTYAWLPTAPGPEQPAAMRNPEAYARVVAAVDREMAAKKLVRTSVDANPDFLVSVLGWTRSGVEVVNYGYTYAGAYAYGPYGAGAMVPVNEVREYTEGTLLLDFVDAKSRKLVWRGTATDTVTSPESVRASIDAAARELLAAYPPPER